MITQSRVSELFPGVFLRFGLHTQSRNSYVLLSAELFFNPTIWRAAVRNRFCNFNLHTSRDPPPQSAFLFPPPPAGTGRKYIQLHIKFEPRPLPAVKKNAWISTCSRLYMLWDYSSWTSFVLISFSFSPSCWNWGCFCAFFGRCSTALTMFSSKQCYSELPRQRCDWLLGRFTHRISSYTSTDALRKHLSWACSCAGAGWTSCCVNTDCEGTWWILHWS